MKTAIKIEGKVELLLDGKVVHKESFNAIGNKLKYLIAQHLGAGGTDFGIDTLFTTNAAQGGAEDGNDGIVVSDGNDGYTAVTTKDSGGAGSTNQIVFKGIYTATGPYTITMVYLGRALDWIDAATPFSTYQFASRSASVTMAANQVLTVLWTITVN